MIRMQERILGEIEKQITDTAPGPTKHYDAVVQATWGNRGIIHAMDGMRSVAEVHYSFQDEHCKIDLRGSHVRELIANGHFDGNHGKDGYRTNYPNDHYENVVFHAIRYTQGDRLELMLRVVRDAVLGVEGLAELMPR